MNNSTEETLEGSNGEHILFMTKEEVEAIDEYIDNPLIKADKIFSSTSPASPPILSAGLPINP